jgi:Fe(3+) dicitrate transport protein
MDGVPVSYAPYGQPQLSLAPVSLGNLSSVDVMRGAGSVRYGPQNVGGIINFVTRAIPKTSGRSLHRHRDLQPRRQCEDHAQLFVGGTNEAGLGGRCCIRARTARAGAQQ